MPGAEWRSDDPRLSIYKRATIVILRPNPEDHGHWMCGMGYVDTKNGWYLHTSFKDHPSVEAWDPDWRWTRAPERSV